MKITGPRVATLWGSLLAVLLTLAAVGHESWVVLSLWGYAVAALYAMSLVVMFANRRSPVHRGAFVWPVSGSFAVPLGLAFFLAGLGGAYGVWFWVLVPAPLALAVYVAVRDRKLRTRMIAARVFDPAAPPYVARAGEPREIPEWPEPGS